MHVGSLIINDQFPDQSNWFILKFLIGFFNEFNCIMNQEY